jgi:hypothetical protein
MLPDCNINQYADDDLHHCKGFAGILILILFPIRNGKNKKN